MNTSRIRGGNPTRSVTAFRQISREGLRVLTAVELGMRRYKVVPVEQIRFYSRTNMDEVTYRLDEIHKLELVVRDRRGVEGYYLNSVGYDVLAINALVGQDCIAEFGPQLGVGKEADVYEVLSPTGERLALKFHRLGRTSFRNVRKLRGYLGARGHMSWLYASRLSAEREYEGLTRVRPLNLPIPTPFAQNRHAVLMSFIDGREIRHFHQLPDPGGLLEGVLEVVRRAYSEAGVVHGDLGEFNILVDGDFHFTIIDWPQWVPSDHPRAAELLERDIDNVVGFFQRRFPGECAGFDAGEVVARILGN
ncbi:MAG: RIO1 family regulatory kinase/ATPase domain-containing protein [Promethearchaeota archaeon]